MSYQTIEAPFERARRILLKHFTTAIQQRQAIGKIAGLAHECRLTPELIVGFAQGHPDLTPNQVSAIMSCVEFLELRGQLPLSLAEARLVTHQPAQQEADLSIHYKRHEPPAAPDKSWTFVKDVR